MEQYVFVCIGTNKIISDSFGPRVGERLKNSFKNYSNIQVWGTMKEPVHFQNANIILKKLEKNKNRKIILVDSAFAINEKIGSTYIGRGRNRARKGIWKKLLFSG